MTPRERNLLADIKRSLVRIYEYCETRSTYSDGERDQWEHVSMIAKDVIRETTMLEAVGEAKSPDMQGRSRCRLGQARQTEEDAK